MGPAMLSEDRRKVLSRHPSAEEDVEYSSCSAQPDMDQSAGGKPLNADRAYKQGIWTLQELLILQAVRREDIVRRKEGFEKQLKEGLAQKELKSRVERWQEIEEACWARNVYRSAEQCQSRWEYMSREWRRIHHHETSCTRFGEPSYWTMSPAERTIKGLVSNFYYELYQALFEWVSKLTRNVPFHHCPGASEGVRPTNTESSTPGTSGAYADCQIKDSNVDTGGTSCILGQASAVEHNGGGKSCRSFVPQFAGPPYQYPAYPSISPCGPGAVFPPFPCPLWIHPTPYSMYPGLFQQPPINLCGQVLVQASCTPFLPSECTRPCLCRAVSPGLSPPFPCCLSASCGTCQTPGTGAHGATCGGNCQHSTKVFHSAPETSMSVDPTHPQPHQSPQKVSEPLFAGSFAEGLVDPMQLCHNPPLKTEPSSFAGHLQCSGCTLGGFLSPDFARTPPPFYFGPPVYLPYPCPRCTVNPWGYSYHPNLHSGQSGCPSPGPPSWGTSELKAQEEPLHAHCAEGVAISELDRQQAEFQDSSVRDLDAEGQEADEPQDDDEPRFVLTDEWAEFFARSAAQRREKKRQQQREAKAARKAAKAMYSTQDFTEMEQTTASFVKSSPPDSRMYVGV